MSKTKKDETGLIPSKYYSDMRLDFMKKGYDDKHFPEYSAIPISQVEEGIKEAEKVIQELRDMLENNDQAHGMLHSENAIEIQQLIEDILVFRYLKNLGGEDFDNFVDTYLPLYRYRWEREGR